MPSASDTVAIILDRNFGERLAKLAEAQPVWAWDSPVNREVAQGLWDAGLVSGEVTIFTAAKARSPEDAFIDILDTIDLHHPKWSQLLVIGGEPTDAMKVALAEYGTGSVNETPAGFIFERSSG